MPDPIQEKIARLKQELAVLEATQAEKAKSAAGFAAAAAHEATRKNRSTKLLSTALQGLEFSAEEFEASHPAIAAAIAEICRDLASVGI